MTTIRPEVTQAHVIEANEASRDLADESSSAPSRTEVPKIEWLENCDPAGWLLEEYKLQSSYYFHEDNYFQRSVGTFATLNSGMVAFYTSKVVSANGASQFAIPAVGITICLLWLVSLLRTRERRRYAENRICHIEETLQEKWSHASGGQLTPLDIGTRAQWNDIGKTGAWRLLRIGWVRNIAASKVFLLLPPAFVAIWVLLIVG